MNVKLSKPAEESLAYILAYDKNLGLKIFKQLKHRLPYDPYPDIDDENDLFHSTIVKNLEKEGLEVHRLKSKEFLSYRVFYIVDEEKDLVYILEVVERNSETYKMGAKHVRTIKDLYTKYYLNRQSKEI